MENFFCSEETMSICCIRKTAPDSGALDPFASELYGPDDGNVIYLLGRHRPELGEGVYVHHSAHVIGDVFIGASASVWCNAVIRGDNGAIHIGEGSNIQDNVVIHARPGQRVRIGNGVSIGHGAIIHGCVIGSNCLIGNNATVMDGAVIEDDTLVGASAIVSGGKTYGPGALLVGNPARLRRALSAAEVEGLRKNALGYVEQAARYCTELKREVQLRRFR
jgi:carbonic anhydrase/acetyltransferase-like protein (isoleucine patch superfamily)